MLQPDYPYLVKQHHADQLWFYLAAKMDPGMKHSITSWLAERGYEDPFAKNKTAILGWYYTYFEPGNEQDALMFKLTFV